MIGPGWAGEPVIALRSITAAANTIDDALTVLDGCEQAQAGRFRHRADRDRFVLGRTLLRGMVGAATGRCPASLRFSRSANGKPVLDGADGIAFNVSHSGDLVMVAVARARALGVDVEQHRHDVDIATLGPLVFTRDEMARLTCAGPAAGRARFFRQWVFKEALVKGLGTGLSRDPLRFQVDDDGGRPEPEFIGESDDDIGEGWLISAIAAPAGYSAALAILHEESPPPIAAGRTRISSN